MLETVLKAIDDLLSIIDRYKIKNVHPQVEDLKYLKKSLNTNDELSTREKFTLIKNFFHHAVVYQIFIIGITTLEQEKQLMKSYQIQRKQLLIICWNGNKII